MKKYDFDKLVDRSSTLSYKWDVGEGVLPMWVADMDFETAPAVKEAVVKRAEHGIYAYSYAPDAVLRVGLAGVIHRDAAQGGGVPDAGDHGLPVKGVRQVDGQPLRMLVGLSQDGILHPGDVSAITLKGKPGERVKFAQDVKN